MTFQVGAFEIQEPVPALNRPRLVSTLQPWIDAGAVGTMALTMLEETWQARPLAQLSRPGTFYDFTRYRPTTYFREGQREVTIPNSTLRYAQRGDGDWLLLRILEPHSHGEEYVESIMAIMKHFGVREYCRIGSMYGPVPHTRPPIVSGNASNEVLQGHLRRLGVREGSRYEGPTTILSLVYNQAQELGMDTSVIMLQLPAYAQLEQDYRGLARLLELLSGLYDLSLDIDSVRQEGDRQCAALDESVQQDPRMRNMVRELEALYDSEAQAGGREQDAPDLPPGLDQFLRDIERRWDESERG